jgi:hypothetical protein
MECDVMDDQAKRKLKICFLLVGIFGSFLFIVVGYWIAAAIGISQQEAEIGFFSSLNRVLGNPFAKYRNNYTPIVMMLAFIIFETFYFLFLVQYRKNERKAELESFGEPEKPGEKMPEPEHGQKDNDWFKSIVTSEREEKIPSPSDLMDGFGIVLEDGISGTSKDVPQNAESEAQEDSENEEREQPEEQFSMEFDAPLTMELMECYDSDQITAMLRLNEHIHNLTGDTLKRMFDPGMSASEISEYISIFYE